MDTTLFLSQVIGAYLFIVGIAMLIRRGELLDLVQELKKNHSLTYVTGVIVTILGVLMTTAHSVWDEGGFATLISILAWLTLLKGVMYLWLPNKSFEKLLDMFRSPGLISAGSILAILLGAYLFFAGMMGF